MREKIEIESQLEKARLVDGSNLPGMSYEEGVAYALEWVLGGDDVPIEG